MLKAACIKSDAWTWIQDCDRTANGRKAWLALVEHYDGSGELNKRVERAKEEIARLHYKDEKVFPFEKYVTKHKENFYVLEKDKSKSLTENKRRYVSAMGSNDQRGGRGRARQGGDGCSGQRNGRGGRGRDGCGRGRGSARRTFANNVDSTDPHRNFSSEEWERLGTMQSYVLQLRECGRGCGDGSSNCHSTTNRSTSSVTTGNNNSSDNNTSNPNNFPTDQSVVSDITDRGSQNGRSFGRRGAYNNNN
ncbi:hypothetical protein MHU86_15543 [Fragilaria crotonensis]|nr:hypothetical protein MHU86_15543 [Fragilaria crotonensis]